MNKWFYLLTHIHIHPLSWLIVAIAILTAQFKELLILFFIVLIHELGHAAAASFFSWRIKNIILLPFGGVLETEEHGNRPIREEFIVTISGPMQHSWMVILAFLLNKYGMIDPQLYTEFVKYNIMIFLFNCLPILPLDGGKLIYLLFSKYYPFLKALQHSILFSIVFLLVYCVVIVSIFPYHLNGWVIALFLFMSLYKEWKHRPYTWMRFLIERYAKEAGDRKVNKIYVRIEEDISQVVEKFRRGYEHQIFVIEAGKTTAPIHESKILKYYFEKSPHQLTIGDLLY